MARGLGVRDAMVMSFTRFIGLILSSYRPSEVMTRNVIAIQLAGGLGNQLFQYAASRALSLRRNCDLLLDLSRLDCEELRVRRPYALDAFQISAEIESPGSRKATWSEYRQPAYCFDPRFCYITARTRLIGYFQSELFFKDYSDIIRADLRLHVPVSAAFESVAAAIKASSNPVSVHLRRGDLVEDPRTAAVHGLCDNAYYEKARKVLEGLVGGPDYFIFTDDWGAADEVFKNLARRQIVRTPPDKPWEDLILMSLCRHHILANSSFSWWGSWLNPRRDKIIVAPRFWFAREALRTMNTSDLYLDGTILI